MLERDRPSLMQKLNRARLDTRLVDELIGLCHGVLADGTIDQSEALLLLDWLETNPATLHNPLVDTIHKQLARVLGDGVLDETEQKRLLETISAFAGSVPRPETPGYATTLPLCQPPPPLMFRGKRYCFTGTFDYGPRLTCEAAVVVLGAKAGALTKRTDYLVIGTYVTDSWAHSSFGRKIEKAAFMRAEGAGIAIVSELHWIAQMRRTRRES